MRDELTANRSVGTKEGERPADNYGSTEIRAPMLDWFRRRLAFLFAPKSVTGWHSKAPLHPSPAAKWQGTERRVAERRSAKSSVAPPATSEAAKSATSASVAAPAADDAPLPEMPQPTQGGGLDAEQHVRGNLETRQREIVEKIGERVKLGTFDLPHLPSTSMVVINLAANPSSEIKEIVDTISTDPVLSSRLLQLSNSALYATTEPVETLHEAVMRIGMRELRSLIFALSMRQVLTRKNQLTSYADEIWRQSYSVGVICREIGPMLGMERDKAFLLGLLHDVGKIPLLSMLQVHAENSGDVTPALVGRVFMDHHERAGEEMAKRWKLSDEFISVAGCHHHYAANEEFARSAALVSLAHRLDLHLSTGHANLYWSQNEYPQLAYLGFPKDRQYGLLRAAHEVFVKNQESHAAEAA